MSLKSDMLAQSDMLACREMIKEGSHTFHAASKVLPRRISDPAIATSIEVRIA